MIHEPDSDAQDSAWVYSDLGQPGGIDTHVHLEEPAIFGGKGISSDNFETGRQDVSQNEGLCLLTENRLQKQYLRWNNDYYVGQYLRLRCRPYNYSHVFL